ncbi:MAG: polysaccharide deacetylase family protein [Nitrospirae bacterium]|nr:polysaccharide deacetylase family protein [Nitrospirota bacterium]
MSERRYIEMKYRAAWRAGMAASALLYLSGVISLFNFFRRRIMKRNISVVLMYHRVSDDGELPDITVSTKKFESHISYLAKNFNVVTVDKIVELFRKGERPARDTAAVTFDDGFKDNYTFAYPVLKKYNIPASVFVAADYVGRDFGLGEDEIREMNRGGVTFGAHTISHPVLSGLSREDAFREINGSKRALEDILGKEVSYFAYPYGKRGRDFNDDSIDIVRECGFRAAFATDNGFITERSILFGLNRIGMRDLPRFVLEARLSGIFESRIFCALRRLAGI